MAISIPTGIQRVFIGIPIDNSAQQKIDNLLKPIKNSLGHVRWVPASNRHLTLAFIGNKPASVVENLIRLFDETYQREAHFQYNISTLTRFPDPKGGIIALVNNPDGPLNRLFQITLELLLGNDLEFYQKEFRPHITLARIRRTKHLETNLERQVSIRLNINKVALFLSTSTESGPIYTKLKQTPLI
jgi:2'-5' RNA ligase